jgi:cardiolipin synthase A/B
MRSPDGRRDHRYCHRNRRPGVRLRAATFLLAVTGATGCGRLPTHETLPSLSAADPAFAATMEAYTNSPVIGGNVIDVLVNGDAIFPAKLAAIRAARTPLAGRIAKSFEEDLAHATRVTYESWRNRGLKAKLLEVFVFPLESQL